MVDEFKSNSPTQDSPDEFLFETSDEISSKTVGPEFPIKDKEKLPFGAVHFAEREIPKDIQLAAQQAMLEQGSTDLKDEPPMKDESAAHFPKLSTVRFSDNLPKAKKIAEPEKFEDTSGEKSSEISGKSLAETSEDDVPHSKRFSSDYSFKDEILSRLHAEAESYEPFMQENKEEEAPKEAERDSEKTILASKDKQDIVTEDFSDKQTDEAENQSLSESIVPADFPDETEISEFSTDNIKLRQNDEPLIQEKNNDLAATRRFTLEIDKDSTQKLSRATTPVVNLSRTERHQRASSKNARVQRATKKSSRIGQSVVVVLIVIFIILGVFSYFYVKDSIGAVNPKNSRQKLVNIPNSTSSGGVAQILEKNHLIKNATVFNYYTKIKGLSDFKSGYYNFSESQTAEQIARELDKGGSATIPALGKITIPEGYSIDQIATAFTINAASKNDAKTPFSKEDFLKIVKDPSFIQKMKNKYPKLFANLPDPKSGVKYQLEGYIFPATYDYTVKTTAEDIVEQMIAAMDKNLSSIYPKLSSLNLDVNQLLSLSAIVEKEANTDSDRKNVADVFLKRLNEGQTLGTNVTLLYAEGKFGTSVSVNDDKNVDTNMDSPFNLYQNQGTGPGPVDSPSMMSIEAVIDHASNDYYYFIADPKTGQIYFAVTEAEQEQNIAQYLNGQ